MTPKSKKSAWQRQPARLRPLSEYPEPQPGAPSPFALCLADLAAVVGDPALSQLDVALPLSYRNGLDRLAEGWLTAACTLRPGTQAFAVAVFWLRRIEGFPRAEDHGRPDVAFVEPPYRRAARRCADLVPPAYPLVFLPSGMPVVAGRAA